MDKDFHTMKRKDLQSLCKKHNLPANSTNLDMATALTSLFNTINKVSVDDDDEVEVLDAPKVVEPKNTKKVRFCLGMKEGEEKKEIEFVGLDKYPSSKTRSILKSSQELVPTTRSRAGKTLEGDIASPPAQKKMPKRGGGGVKMGDDQIVAAAAAAAVHVPEIPVVRSLRSRQVSSTGKTLDEDIASPPAQEKMPKRGGGGGVKMGSDQIAAAAAAPVPEIPAVKSLRSRQVSSTGKTSEADIASPPAQEKMPKRGGGGGVKMGNDQIVSAPVPEVPVVRSLRSRHVSSNEVDVSSQKKEITPRQTRRGRGGVEVFEEKEEEQPPKHVEQVMVDVAAPQKNVRQTRSRKKATGEESAHGTVALDQNTQVPLVEQVASKEAPKPGKTWRRRPTTLNASTAKEEEEDELNSQMSLPKEDNSGTSVLKHEDMDAPKTEITRRKRLSTRNSSTSKEEEAAKSQVTLPLDSGTPVLKHQGKNASKPEIVTRRSRRNASTPETDTRNESGIEIQDEGVSKIEEPRRLRSQKPSVAVKEPETLVQDEGEKNSKLEDPPRPFASRASKRKSRVLAKDSETVVQEDGNQISKLEDPAMQLETRASKRKASVVVKEKVTVVQEGEEKNSKLEDPPRRSKRKYVAPSEMIAETDKALGRNKRRKQSGKLLEEEVTSIPEAGIVVHGDTERVSKFEQPKKSSRHTSKESLVVVTAKNITTGELMESDQTMLEISERNEVCQQEQSSRRSRRKSTSDRPIAVTYEATSNEGGTNSKALQLDTILEHPSSQDVQAEIINDDQTMLGISELNEVRQQEQSLRRSRHKRTGDKPIAVTYEAASNEEGKNSKAPQPETILETEDGDEHPSSQDVQAEIINDDADSPKIREMESKIKQTVTEQEELDEEPRLAAKESSQVVTHNEVEEPLKLHEEASDVNPTGIVCREGLSPIHQLNRPDYATHEISTTEEMISFVAVKDVGDQKCCDEKETLVKVSKVDGSLTTYSGNEDIGVSNNISPFEEQDGYFESEEPADDGIAKAGDDQSKREDIVEAVHTEKPSEALVEETYVIENEGVDQSNLGDLMEPIPTEKPSESVEETNGIKNESVDQCKLVDLVEAIPTEKPSQISVEETHGMENDGVDQSKPEDLVAAISTEKPLEPLDEETYGIENARMDQSMQGDSVQAVYSEKPSEALVEQTSDNRTNEIILADTLLPIDLVSPTRFLKDGSVGEASVNRQDDKNENIVASQEKTEHSLEKKYDLNVSVEGNENVRNVDDPVENFGGEYNGEAASMMHHVCPAGRSSTTDDLFDIGSSLRRTFKTPVSQVDKPSSLEVEAGHSENHLEDLFDETDIRSEKSAQSDTVLQSANSGSVQRILKIVSIGEASEVKRREYTEENAVSREGKCEQEENLYDNSSVEFNDDIRDADDPVEELGEEYRGEAASVIPHGPPGGKSSTSDDFYDIGSSLRTRLSTTVSQVDNPSSLEVAKTTPAENPFVDMFQQTSDIRTDKIAPADATLQFVDSGYLSPTEGKCEDTREEKLDVNISAALTENISNADGLEGDLTGEYGVEDASMMSVGSPRGNPRGKSSTIDDMHDIGSSLGRTFNTPVSQVNPNILGDVEATSTENPSEGLFGETSDIKTDKVAQTSATLLSEDSGYLSPAEEKCEAGREESLDANNSVNNTERLRNAADVMEELSGQCSGENDSMIPQGSPRGKRSTIDDFEDVGTGLRRTFCTPVSQVRNPNNIENVEDASTGNSSEDLFGETSDIRIDKVDQAEATPLSEDSSYLSPAEEKCESTRESTRGESLNADNFVNNTDSIRNAADVMEELSGQCSVENASMIPQGSPRGKSSTIDDFDDVVTSLRRTFCTPVSQDHDPNSLEDVEATPKKYPTADLFQETSDIRTDKIAPADATLVSIDSGCLSHAEAKCENTWEESLNANNSVKYNESTMNAADSVEELSGQCIGETTSMMMPHGSPRGKSTTVDDFDDIGTSLRRTFCTPVSHVHNPNSLEDVEAANKEHPSEDLFQETSDIITDTIAAPADATILSIDSGYISNAEEKCELTREENPDVNISVKLNENVWNADDPHEDIGVRCGVDAASMMSVGSPKGKSSMIDDLPDIDSSLGITFNTPISQASEVERQEYREECLVREEKCEHTSDENLDGNNADDQVEELGGKYFAEATSVIPQGSSGNTPASQDLEEFAIEKHSEALIEEASDIRPGEIAQVADALLSTNSGHLSPAGFSHSCPPKVPNDRSLGEASEVTAYQEKEEKLNAEGPTEEVGRNYSGGAVASTMMTHGSPERKSSLISDCYDFGTSLRRILHTPVSQVDKPSSVEAPEMHNSHKYISADVIFQSGQIMDANSNIEATSDSQCIRNVTGNEQNEERQFSEFKVQDKENLFTDEEDNSHFTEGKDAVLEELVDFEKADILEMQGSTKDVSREHSINPDGQIEGKTVTEVVSDCKTSIDVSEGDKNADTSPFSEPFAPSNLEKVTKVELKCDLEMSAKVQEAGHGEPVQQFSEEHFNLTKSAALEIHSSGEDSDEQIMDAGHFLVEADTSARYDRQDDHIVAKDNENTGTSPLSEACTPSDFEDEVNVLNIEGNSVSDISTDLVQVEHAVEYLQQAPVKLVDQFISGPHEVNVLNIEENRFSEVSTDLVQVEHAVVYLQQAPVKHVDQNISGPPEVNVLNIEEDRTDLLQVEHAVETMQQAPVKLVDQTISGPQEVNVSFDDVSDEHALKADEVVEDKAVIDATCCMGSTNIDEQNVETLHLSDFAEVKDDASSQQLVPVDLSGRNEVSEVNHGPSNDYQYYGDVKEKSDVDIKHFIEIEDFTEASYCADVSMANRAASEGDGQTGYDNDSFDYEMSGWDDLFSEDNTGKGDVSTSEAVSEDGYKNAKEGTSFSFPCVQPAEDRGEEMKPKDPSERASASVHQTEDEDDKDEEECLKKEEVDTAEGITDDDDGDDASGTTMDGIDSLLGKMRLSSTVKSSSSRLRNSVAGVGSRRLFVDESVMKENNLVERKEVVEHIATPFPGLKRRRALEDLQKTKDDNKRNRLFNHH